MTDWDRKGKTGGWVWEWVRKRDEWKEKGGRIWWKWE